MYSYEDRIRAVKLYIQYDFKASAVMHELGYPNNPKSIKAWYLEFKENSDLHKERSPRRQKYSAEEKNAAVEHFLQHGKCVNRTVNSLGYPSRPVLTRWIREISPDLLSCKKKRSNVYFSQSQKEQAVVALCSKEAPAKEIAEDYGITRAILYNWKKQVLPKERTPLMAKISSPLSREEASLQISELKEEVTQLTHQAEELKRQIHKLELEKSILEKASEVLKKAQGVSISTLTNREKAIVINALRDRFKLKDLLDSIQMAKSSYCYQAAALKTDKYQEIRKLIRIAFEAARGRYGYRRIHASITADGRIISEKVVLRIMKEEDLCIRKIKHMKYNSYRGEISPEVDNVIRRDFHADNPNEKWLTDITEFRIPSGKIYLSPIIDCFDGMPVSWTIGTSPDADLVNSMLDEAISTLKPNEKPIVHSDRGCHYRWPGWIKRIEDAGLTRSMSRKGCSPDNAACEGFFGRLKNEMFYGVSWLGVSIDEFIEELDQYIRWYAEDRIKVSLGGKSPVNYRRSLGLMTD